jgi:hypothetical protein
MELPEMLMNCIVTNRITALAGNSAPALTIDIPDSGVTGAGAI